VADSVSDIYYTIDHEGQGRLTEKMSRFLAFTFHVTTAEEARGLVKRMANEWHDARHVCWAYMLGPSRDEYQSNDNGEPSGTAGRPILGQINSAGLTDVLVVVVRYFGGIKLGTPGLIAAYREAARLAIEDSGRKEVVEEAQIALTCRYESVNGVMKIVKELNLTIVSQEMGMECSYVLSMPRSILDGVSGRLDKLNGVRME
jgi:uncharacterized YigZ family protein